MAQKRSDLRIVIVDDSESIALWIASASYALPPHLAWRLSFNTYDKNPYQTDVLIAGTTLDSDFAFSPPTVFARFVHETARSVSWREREKQMTAVAQKTPRRGVYQTLNR